MVADWLEQTSPGSRLEGAKGSCFVTEGLFLLQVKKY